MIQLIYDDTKGYITCGKVNGQVLTFSYNMVNGLAPAGPKCGLYFYKSDSCFDDEAGDTQLNLTDWMDECRVVKKVKSVRMFCLGASEASRSTRELPFEAEARRQRKRRASVFVAAFASDCLLIVITLICLVILVFRPSRLYISILILCKNLVTRRRSLSTLTFPRVSCLDC